ncbi:hypothetical protein NMG60_11031819 [Bertholletia excelsa]
MDNQEMEFFSLLPEGCISTILSLTSPRDVCRSSAISPVFKAVTDSDPVWEAFLPPDYREILSRSVSPVAFTAKKQLYLGLADNPILLEGGKISFALDKESGKKCYMLGARKLLIAWGDTPRYWRWRSLPQSRFPEVAILEHVWWLDIRGRINSLLLSPETCYVAYLVFKIAEKNAGLEYTCRSSVRCLSEGGEGIEDESGITTTVYLKLPRRQRLNGQHGRFPRKRNDEWMELELGEFFNEGNDGEVEMRLLETRSCKHGLVVEGIEFRPKAGA